MSSKNAERTATAIDAVQQFSYDARVISKNILVILICCTLGYARELSAAEAPAGYSETEAWVLKYFKSWDAFYANFVEDPKHSRPLQLALQRAGVATGNIKSRFAVESYEEHKYRALEELPGKMSTYFYEYREWEKKGDQVEHHSYNPDRATPAIVGGLLLGRVGVLLGAASAGSSYSYDVRKGKPTGYNRYASREERYFRSLIILEKSNTQLFYSGRQNAVIKLSGQFIGTRSANFFNRSNNPVYLADSGSPGVVISFAPLIINRETAKQVYYAAASAFYLNDDGSLSPAPKHHLSFFSDRSQRKFPDEDVMHRALHFTAEMFNSHTVSHLPLSDDERAELAKLSAIDPVFRSIVNKLTTTDFEK